MDRVGCYFGQAGRRCLAVWKRFLDGSGPTFFLAVAVLILAASIFYDKKVNHQPIATGTVEAPVGVPPIAPKLEMKQPAGSAAGQKQTGTCTALKRGLTAFACPSTPTGDVCGVSPQIYCYQGADESCPVGTYWDPACSCTCLPTE